MAHGTADRVAGVPEINGPLRVDEELREVVDGAIGRESLRHRLTQLFRFAADAVIAKAMSAWQRPVDAARGPVVLGAHEAHLLADLPQRLLAESAQIQLNQGVLAVRVGIVVEIDGFDHVRTAILAGRISGFEVHIHLHVRSYHL